MFETLAWELEAAATVGLGSLFSSKKNENEKKDVSLRNIVTDFVNNIDDNLNSQRWVGPIMAIGESEEDAHIYSRIIHKALKNNLVIDKHIARSISENIKEDVTHVENACDIYRQLTFFSSKGITDNGSLRKITAISKALVADDGESLKDPNIVASEYGFSLEEVKSVIGMLNEFASKYQSTKPFTVNADPDPNQTQPKQQQSSRKNNNKNNSSTGTNQ